MRVLITGGAGFIGLHLAKRLTMEGNSVVIYDNLSNSKISDLEDSNIRLIKGDILDFDLLCDSLEGLGCVVHLAALIDVKYSIRFPQKTMKINVDGTINVLKACLKAGVKNLVAASSSAVYGEKTDLPIKEDSEKKPISPYGESKLKMEEEIQNFSEKNNINSISLRFFNIYGKGQTLQYAGVITKFLDRISKNQPIEIFGDGKNTRDFVHIDDAVESIILSMKNIEGKRGNAYNIGIGETVTINELADILIAISGENIPITHTEPVKGDIRDSCASIELAKKDIGYKPKVELQAGLKRLYNQW